MGIPEFLPVRKRLGGRGSLRCLGLPETFRSKNLPRNSQSEATKNQLPLWLPADYYPFFLPPHPSPRTGELSKVWSAEQRAGARLQQPSRRGRGWPGIGARLPACQARNPLRRSFGKAGLSRCHPTRHRPKDRTACPRVRASLIELSHGTALSSRRSFAFHRAPGPGASGVGARRMATGPESAASLHPQSAAPAAPAGPVHRRPGHKGGKEAEGRARPVAGYLVERAIGAPHFHHQLLHLLVRPRAGSPPPRGGLQALEAQPPPPPRSRTPPGSGAAVTATARARRPLASLPALSGAAPHRKWNRNAA